MNTAPLKILVVGAGYVGGELAQSLVRQNLPTAAICSSRNSMNALQAQDPQLEIHSVNLDIPSPGWVDTVFGANVEPVYVVYLVPPNQTHPHDVRLQTFLASMPKEPKKFVYISTTGVYGDCGGNVVTESSPLAPASNRAKLRVDAEHQVAEYCRSRKTIPTILRVAGIYGPNRLPIEAIRSKRPLINRDEANPGNRIHRDDLVDIIAACLAPGPKSGSEFTDSERKNTESVQSKQANAQPTNSVKIDTEFAETKQMCTEVADGGHKCTDMDDSGPASSQTDPSHCTTSRNIDHSNAPFVLNVCDGNHLNSTKFTQMVAQLIGLPAPPEISREEMRSTANPQRWSFLAESRIIDTTKLQQFLTTPLRFTDPHKGIQHSLKHSLEVAKGHL